MTELLRATHEIGLGNTLAVCGFAVLVIELRRAHAKVAHLEGLLRRAMSARRRRR